MLEQKKYIKDLEDRTVGKLVNNFQLGALQLATMATYSKARVDRYERKMHVEAQALRKKVELSDKQSSKLHREFLSLNEKSALAKSRVI